MQSTMDNFIDLLPLVLFLFGILDHVNASCGIDDSFQAFGPKAYKVLTDKEPNWIHRGYCLALGSGKLACLIVCFFQFR